MLKKTLQLVTFSLYPKIADQIVRFQDMMVSEINK